MLWRFGARVTLTELAFNAAVSLGGVSSVAMGGWLLVERGARLDLKDILWHATPAGWAQHAGKRDIEAYLRAQEKHRARSETV